MEATTIRFLMWVRKKRLQREGTILTQFDTSREVIEEVYNYLEINQE